MSSYENRCARLAMCMVLISWITVGPTPAQTFPWVQTAGGVDEDAGAAMAVEPGTGVYATGHFAGQSSFGTNVLTSAGGLDVFLCKFSTNRDLLWSTRFGGTGDDQGSSLVLDAEGFLHMAGSFSGRSDFDGLELVSAGLTDAFLAKLDRNGHVLWCAAAGGAGRDSASGVATDPIGNSYIVGTYEQTARFGSTNLPAGGQRQLFVAKYNPAGGLLWARNTGGGEMAVGTSVAADSEGNVWAGGHYYPAPPDTLTTSGIVARYTASGEPTWWRTFPSERLSSTEALGVDLAGDGYLTGYFDKTARFGQITLASRGDRDVFVVKVNRKGEVLWARRAGGVSTDVTACLAVDPEGGCLVGGYFIGLADFGTLELASGGSADAFVAKLDSNGQFLWAVQAGGSVNMEAYGLALDPGFAAYFTGYYRYQTAFGPFFLTNHSSGRDTFFARLNVPPTPRVRVASLPGFQVLSWPAALSDFHLESASEFTRSAWAPVTNAPARIDQRTVLTNAATGERRFFRLRR